MSGHDLVGIKTSRAVPGTLLIRTYQGPAVRLTPGDALALAKRLLDAADYAAELEIIN